ncbi:hypothetical protein ACVWXO_008002 [Bradyrhizobium sp. LM2.7]
MVHLMFFGDTALKELRRRVGIEARRFTLADPPFKADDHGSVYCA